MTLRLRLEPGARSFTPMKIPQRHRLHRDVATEWVLFSTGLSDSGHSKPGGFRGEWELAIRGNSRHVPVMKSKEGIGAAEEAASKHGRADAALFRRVQPSTKRKNIMETSRLYFLSVPVFVAVAMLSGCGRGSGQPTNISYRQVGICKSFVAASGPVTSRADEGYAVFKIETVDNKSNKPFAFDPKFLYVDQSTPAQHAKQLWEWDRRYASADSRIPQSLGISLAPETTIPAGGKLDVNGFLVIPLGINNPSHGPEENKFAFQLLHDSGTSENTASGQIRVSEGIVFNKTNAADTKWTVAENCKELPLK